MNSELKKLRRHYEGLLPHAKALTTSQSLLKAIQIAEQLAEALKPFADLLDGDSENIGGGTRMSPEISVRMVLDAKSALARVTKEGE